MSEVVPQKTVKTAAQRRSICTWTGIAVGFRAFYALTVDGAQMFSGGWIAVLLSGLLALPVMLALREIRRAYPNESAVQAFRNTAGTWLSRLTAAVLFAVLTYDSAAVLRLMNSTAKYVAIPEGNRIVIMGVTALAGTAAVLLGTSAAANAAVLWKKLMPVLIGILIVTQMRHFQGAWLFPILGAGGKVLLTESVPAAGIFCFAVCGWLMMEPQHDQNGAAMPKMLMHTVLMTAVIVLLFAMLLPGMLSEPPGRGFRIGRLLMNDRSGLSLEMPYVVLIYGGMLCMLIFELSASAAALNLCIGRLKRNVCVIAAGAVSLAAAAGGAAEREILRSLSPWYYPLIAVPFVIAGVRAFICMRRKKS